jgi:hypothetical protein
VDGARTRFPPPQNAVHLHQAAGIDRGHKLGSTSLNIPHFRVAHGGGNHAELGRECAAEASTVFAVLHLHDFKAANMTQQFTRRLLQAQLAQRVTGIVIGNPVREARTHVGDAGAVDLELEKLKHPLAEFDHIFVPGGSSPAIRGKSRAPWWCTRPKDRRQFLIAKKVDEPFRQRPCLIPISGIEGWLPATRLLLLQFHRTPNPPQDGGHIEANLRNQLIHEARDQHRNFPARLGHEDAADS